MIILAERLLLGSYKGLQLEELKSPSRHYKDGIFEIKITHGPGYRVYFAEDGAVLIILLIGGDKKTQKRDIEKAKEYWRNYGK